MVTLILLATLAQSAAAQAVEAPIAVREVADYRLTADVFARFVDASRRIVDVTRHDAIFTFAPLFTKDVALSGDAGAEASGLTARLANHAGLAAALEAAKLAPREYAKFAISLVGAHLAHGFVKAGVLRSVPPGPPTINVEFVKQHEVDVTATLAALGIHD
jgi:hypothetical protein